MSLFIQMFGTFTVATTSAASGVHNAASASEDSGSAVKLPHLMEAVLAYLLLHKRPCTRDALLGQFWGDCPNERARRCLNTTLWRLRCTLEPEGVPPGTYLISDGQDEIGFNRHSSCWIDLDAFEQGLSPVLSKPASTLDDGEVERAKQALTLCTGEVLEGLFDDWALREREHARQMHLNGLGQLMTYYQMRGHHNEALAYGRQILELEPLREDVHREVMRMHVELGQRTLALKQYERCQAILKQELGIAPMPETRALLNSIVCAREGAAAINPVLHQALSVPAHTLGRTQLAEHDVAQLRTHLQSMLLLVERVQDEIRALIVALR